MRGGLRGLMLLVSGLTLLAWQPGVATAPRAAASEGAEVLLRSRRFVPPPGRRATLEQARREGVSGRFHALVQFDDVPTAVDRARLARAGVRLEGYIPHNAWRASIPVDLDPDDPALDGVRSIVRLDPADKIDPRLRSRRLDPIGVYVQFHDDVPEAGRRLAVTRAGGAVVDRIGSLSALAVRLPAAGVEPLASEDAVAWIEEALPLLTGANDGVRADLGIAGIWADPIRGLDGTGIDVLVFDQGRIDDSHPDLSGRVVVGDAVAVAAHSTHVAGTLAGDGTQSGGTLAGVAPGATLVSYALSGYNAGIFMYSNPGDLEADFTAAIQQHGADLANLSLGSNIKLNSYPCSILGDYGITSALLDAIVGGSLGPLFPVVVAGGNERPSGTCMREYATTAPPAGAKNVLSVGAVYSDTDGMTGFSAWGPTDDGRLKPDLVAPGCQVGGDGGVTSTYPAGTYGTLCGTSHGAPAVTGVMAMLVEETRAEGRADPAPASLRALAYHTALDLGPPGPDYSFGYGRLRPREALDTLRAGAVQRGTVGHHEVRSHSVVVVDPNAPFLATLAWDDPPASAGAAVALVNDLDLEVYDPAGVRRFPWTLDPNTPSQAAVQTREDHVNNMEQVYVPATALTGLWRVEVAGSLVATGAPQSYSLIVSSGAAAQPSDGFVTTDRPVYACGDDIGIDLSDQDLAGTLTTDVTAASTTDPNGITVTLTEQATPGTFSGTIPGGQLALSHGDIVSITHPQTGPAIAHVDCVAPVISEVAVTAIDSTSARVTWRTDEPADTRRDGVPLTYATTLDHEVTLTGLAHCGGQTLTISSADAAGNEGMAPPVVFETLGETLLYQDGFETGAPGWQNPSQSGSQWLLTTVASASPTHSFTDSVGGNYQGNTTNGLISPSYDLTGARNVVLAFNHKYAMEEGFDFGQVQISINGGAWSAPVASFSGISYGFKPARVVLPRSVENQPDVRFRFLLVSDNSLSFDGWYIDDVTLLSRPDCSEVENLGVVTEPVMGATRLQWDSSPAGDAYNVYRGGLPMTGFAGHCLRARVSGATADDLTSDPNGAYYYLVTGTGPAGEGAFGFTSAGEYRGTVPCPIVLEAGWNVARVDVFRDPIAARYNPVDGLLYVGRSLDPNKGLYRIEGSGAATPIWTGDDIASVLVDPDDGDVFASDEVKGKIYRTAFGATGKTDWVTGFHSGDDDPVGMAIAPAGYTGSVLAPGEALVADRGAGGSAPKEIWKWSPGVAEGEAPVHSEDGTLVEPLDVAVTDDAVYVLDSGGAADGAIYAMAPGGAVTPLVTSRPLPEPLGMTVDPLTGDLIVVGREATGGTVSRVDPATGKVTDMIRGLLGTAWGSVSVSPDGSRLVVTDAAAGLIFTFAR